MKRLLLNTLLFAFTLLTCSFTCTAQNGPTQPTVALTWTQSTSTGVTANCVYRGSAAGTYILPAIFCSTAPITSYIDSTVVASTTYHYAVTAKVGSTESGYSNDVTAAVPASPNAPVLNTPTETGKIESPGQGLVAEVKWVKRQDK